jgi:hypothetical protein
MPAKSGRRSSSKIEQAGEKPVRKGFKLAFASEFQKSLPNDPIMKAMILASVQDFFVRWSSVDSIQELSKSKWQYKPLRGKRPGGEPLYQMYVNFGKTAFRVFNLEVWGNPCEVLILLCCRKGDQQLGIKRAEACASKFWEKKRG